MAGIWATALTYATVAAGEYLPAAIAWLVIMALAELLFARRMGFSLGEDELALHRAVATLRIPRSEVRSVEWRPSWRQKEEYLYVSTAHGARLPVPTVQRSSSGGLLGRLSSPLARTRDGELVDVDEIFARWLRPSP